ncbi:hypothetical protein HDU91_003288 [Kappamyces sp. JEL0680]|nr:hypothetical protein HDU91_003288 [Kappamyces sp. JEL0680]
MPFVVGLVLESSDIPGAQKLKALKVDIGDDVLDIVTNASNVKAGMKTVVATEGTSVEGDDGSEIVVAARAVGGVKSRGIICDGKMLGWGSTNQGLAVRLPDEFIPGSPAPASNPRSMSAVPASGEPTIKEKKEQEKAARKAELQAKRAAKKAEKDAKAAAIP